MPQIYVKQDGTKIVLPVLPPGWSATSEQNNTSVDVNAVGETTLMGKRKLRTIPISSFFPKDQERYGAKYSPVEYVEKIEKMKRKGPVKLHLMDIFTIDATIESFTPSEDETDPTGDIHYTLNFKEYIYPTVKITTKVKKKKTTTRKTKTVKHGRSAPISKRFKTCTVKPNQCLSEIAKKAYGKASDWRKIYNANKKVIGSNPNLIHSGQKLVIP